MLRAGSVRARLAMRGWPVADASAGVLAYMFPVNAIALILCLVAVLRIDGSAGSWGVLLLLVAISVAFEEGSRRAARLQIRLSSQLRTDMTSVWAVAGAVALSPGMAVLLLGAVLLYAWLRQWRPAGEALYRKWFVVSTILLGCLVAGAAAREVADVSHGLPWALTGSLPVLVAVAAYTTINRLLVTVGLVVMGVRGRILLGSRHDNLIELSTLCLGGLVSLAVLYQPWLALLVVAPMVTLQRGALVRELETAASTDSKTGLLNAVAWDHLAQRELARSQRDETPLAILIIDIDRFKLVNDRYGHLVGDAVLRGVGRCLDAEVREYDTVGRFGGEEFVAVLPDTDDGAAMAVAERLRSRVNELSVTSFVDGLDDDGKRMSVSIGASCTPVDGKELSELLYSADQALYRAKENGRNQVRLAYRGGGTLADRVTQS